MNTSDKQVPAEIDPVSREAPKSDDLPRVGEWYWVTSTNHRQEPHVWLGCVMKVGSNFVELHSPHGEQSYEVIRVHIDEIDDVLKFEPDADAYIRAQIDRYQGEVNALMGKVRDTYAALGIATGAAVDQSAPASTALATVAGQADVRRYEKALVVAKKETLPALFGEIKNANSALTKWMTAPTMALLATVEPLKEQIESINDRIFNISLYAGLTEQAELVTPGAAPAPMEEKLHVMQRRLYMDEECLLEYEAGGMEFKDIRAFDAWLSRPSNRDRLLPFQRTLVAFQVRRHGKERDSEGNISTAFINFELGQADTLSFLYIRNGEQVWRMSCDMDFGTLIFPEVTHLDPGEPMMVKMFGSSVDRLMSRREFDELTARWKENDKLRRAWSAEHPKKDGIRNPYGWMSDNIYIDGHGSFSPRDWKPFDFSNLHYDEALARLAAQIKEYNRVAVIIQGLFDRSEVLHPHAPVKSWTEDGFASAIKLVYDGTAVLYAGEKPDFEAYRNRLNASLSVGSIVTGADDHWARVEAIKEGKRRDRDWRDKSHYRPTRWRPDGNPGPGVLAKVVSMKGRNATFTWVRKSSDWRRRRDSFDASITIPVDQLLNVSAYQPGDFKQFYRDPRTRADYLKWAPLLLMAEDYHAGKRSLDAETRPAQP